MDFYRYRVSSLVQACIIFALCSGTSSVSTADADEPAIVVEDEAVIVTDDDGIVIVEETADRGWKALPVEPHEVGGETAYIRQSTDAFADPDAPLDLEPNYYFVLEEVPWSGAGYLTRAQETPEDETIELGRRARKLPYAEAFPFPQNIDRLTGDLHLEWIDVQVGPLESRRTMAALYVPEDSDTGELDVLRVSKERQGWQVDRIGATREVTSEDFSQALEPGSLIDTYNPPDELGGARVFFSKVIAVLTKVDGRYAVEFFGDNLSDSGATRVWLTEEGNSMGRPVAIRFVELPIARDEERVVPATVLAVAYENSDGERTAIAIDYPLASTPLMVQMRQLLTRGNNDGGGDDTQDRLTKILGADLVDELSRRLVNAQY